MFNKKNKNNNKNEYNTTKNNSKNTGNNENLSSLEDIYGIYASNTVKSAKAEKTVRVKNGNRVVRPVYALFFVLCFIYILGCAYGFITKRIVSYDVVQMGIIDTPKTVQGVIIRDEKVYTADEDGVISYDVADNEKVKKDTEICTIKDENVVNTIEDELEDIDESIMKVQSEREDISIYSEDIKQDNKEIQTLIDDNAIDYAKKNFGNIYELKNNIQKKMDVRNELLLTENKGSLSKLVTQRNNQISKLNDNISKITVEEGGIISYYIDGMEDKYTVTDLSNYSKEDTKVTTSPVSSFKSKVSKGNPAFKLVKSNEWYVVCYIPGEYTKEWETGDIITIYAKDSLDATHDLPAKIQEIQGAETDAERYTVLKITKDMIDFITERSISFDIEKATSGYKIPNTAIVEETLLKIPLDYVNEEDLYLTKADGTKVNIIISDKDTENNIAYIPVQLGVLNVGDTIQKTFTKDTFVIQDVLNTRGVYVMNTGYAEFKRIYTEKSVSNNTHTILNPAINPNVNIYDRIVSNAENIEREEKVIE